MNPYDRRAVRNVWARVSPGRDVFAKGPWPPAPPPGLGQGGKPPSQSQGSRPPMPPNVSPLAGNLLLELAGGYDGLAKRLRSPALRQMAAQCRRGEAELFRCTGQHGKPPRPQETTLAIQREREELLRQALAAMPERCSRMAHSLSRESMNRTNQLARMR